MKRTFDYLIYSAEAHPLYLGCCALSAMDYPHVCIKNADLIINIGHDVVEKPPFFME
jgi:acetolactate synthase-1/2/3 large subunit